MRLGRRRGPTEEPTFLLGVGAQKAGTSWLHDHLAASAQCQEGYRKEFHVFDALDLPEERWKLDSLARRARREAGRALAGEAVDATSLHRASMIYQPEFYLDYFAGLLSRSERTRLVLDMTPDYALLPAPRLSWIRDGFAARGIRTVSVFLMRDPVERIWSHLRMEKARRPERLSGDSEQYVRERHGEHQYAARTRYDQTLERLDQTFRPGEVHVEFFERLFTPEAVAQIERHVGIEGHRPDFGRMVNASPKSAGDLPVETERLVARSLRPVYQDVARRWPEVDLPGLWPSARHVL